MKTTIGFIGLGLIGGSMAKAVRKKLKDDVTIIAYNRNKDSLLAAYSDGVIDVVCETIDSTFSSCDMIILCAPVATNIEKLTELKQYISSTCMITDVGSVKTDIHLAVNNLGLTSQFIGGHPMTGSEKTGYQNSSDRLFENAYYVITPTDAVSEDKVAWYQSFVTDLGAIPLKSSYEEHDFVTAAISHLPHIIASSLVNLVSLEDKKHSTMSVIAAGGFKDITRIASSSTDMWQQICLANKENISSLLKNYIRSLDQILISLQSGNANEIFDFFSSAKGYRDSLNDNSSGPIIKTYYFYVDLPDEPGVIATLATILANNSISLKNIGIIHNREFEEGVLRIEFYDHHSLENASYVLQNEGYVLHNKNR